MDPVLLEKLPDLHVEHDHIYIPRVGPPAAFRLLTLKEVRGYTNASYVGDLFLSDAIIRRTLLYPALDVYEESPAGVYEAVAADILRLSAPNSAQEVSEQLTAARGYMDDWIAAVQFLVFRHLNISIEQTDDMYFQDLLSIVAGLEGQLDTDFDPLSVGKGQKSSRKPPDRLEKAQRAHDRAEAIKRSQEPRQDLSQLTPKPVSPQDDGKFVLQSSEEEMSQQTALQRKERWEGLKEGMKFMEERGRDPAELPLTGIYEDPYFQTVSATALGKANLTIQTLPLDIMASIKHIRKRGSNTGLDFNKLSYLGE